MCWAQIAAAGLGAAAKYKEGQLNAQGLEYQANLDDYNAGIAKKEAKKEERIGVFRVSEFQVRGDIFAGQQIAVMGAGGTDIGSGSNIDIRMDTAQGIATDKQKLVEDYISKRNAHLRSRNLFLLDATINRRRAKSAREAGILGAVSIASSSGAQIYGQYQSSSYYSQGKT